ncbi:DUF6491 family protein [Sphingomonas sp.]|uniref:DUF6491 family protein n=1 Tax=Sphingomonas sp. TaxID=28214 RepID=UPI001EBBF4F0|nr:DUF6491 family protein [Sphingomonas sp.]MBX3593710.1 hypothetical protein [Sphingomonas sp.]
MIANLALILAAAALPAIGQTPPPAPATPVEARIPFASMIRDFRAEDRHAIYLRAGRQWYRGTFFAPCDDLPWTWRIAFNSPAGASAVDRFSTVLLGNGQRCQLDSLVKIDGDPPKTARKPAKPAAR